ncbi:hypothetical protein JCM16303_000480 [Sporobolomyces ruberrimus]
MGTPGRDKGRRSSEIELDPRLPQRLRSPPQSHPKPKPFRLVLIGIATLGFVYLAYHQVYSFYSPSSSSSSSSSSSRGSSHSSLFEWGRPSKKFPTTIPSSSSPFPPSEHPLPVHFQEHLVLYENTPVSSHRPRSNQFLLDPKADLSRPEIAIITATNNPRPEMLLDTATTVFGQSLQNFVWVIVDDHTDLPESLDLLKDLSRDPRVVIVKNPGTQGLSAGRNVGIDYILTHYAPTRIPPYLCSLDDDDLFEFTAFEKSIWMLKSNPEWDLAGFRYIKFGSSNETVMTGLHSGADNFFKGNFVPNSAIYTSRAILESKCRYDEVEFHDGGEDWDFWMCLAEKGFWGGSLIEPLYWYRVNDPKFRASRWGNTFVDGFDALKQHIQKRHPSLGKTGGFPAMKPKQNVQLEPVSWDMPYESALARTDKAVVFVVPWLYVGGADIGALHMIQLYAEAGYRVSVILTLSRIPDGIELLPQVLQFTHDVHLIPSFLRAHDFPRYFKHIIESRGAKQVILSNSQLTYELLPALTEQMPDVEFVDYLHNEAYDGWKSGGYPRYSLIFQRYLSRTITCSHYLKQWLLEKGHLDASRIGVVKLGIETTHFVPPSPAARNQAKSTLLSLEPETIVITVVARLDPQKRSTLVPRIAKKFSTLTDEDFVIIMIGDGDLRKPVERMIEQEGVGEFVKLLGNKDDPVKYLEATDIFLLPSMSEGISVAVTEAMAMGLPIVTARAGALPEQLGELDDQGHKKIAAALGGILIDHELDLVHDVPAYAEALHSLMIDPTTRRRLGSNARKLVETGFDWRTSLAEMFVETDKAQNLGGHGIVDTRYPNPSAYLATQMLLCENWKETDMLGNYPW